MMAHNSNKPYSTTRRRTHLKPSQVAVLQESFVTNTLPDATIRAQLALELGVTERTVQIWFQNRRAKARKLEALSPGSHPTSLMPNVRTGWVEMPHANSNYHQATFRAMMTPECYQQQNDIKRRPRSCSKPEKATFPLIPHPPRAMSEGIGRTETTKDDKMTSKRLVNFTVNAIRIGSWARFANPINNNEWDLVCYSDPTHKQLIWQVQDDGHQFRIEVSFENIQQVRLGQVSTDTMMGQLEIDIIQGSSVTFSMRRAGVDLDWVRCGDFTENTQASNESSHALQGTHDSLRQSLLELISQAPTLASKLVLVPSAPMLAKEDDFCRESISPSATPEPFANYFNGISSWTDPAKMPQFYPDTWPYLLDTPQFL